MSNTTRPPIAVVGVSALFPGSTSSAGFWRDILAGDDLLSDVPASHWLPEDYYDADPRAPDKTYARRGGFLPKIDFDALHWGVPPNIIEATDTSQLLALIVAEQVLRDAANGQFETMDRSRISCILGVTSGQELLGTMVSRLQRPIWQKSLREHGLPEDQVEAVCQRIADHYVPWQESSFPGLLGNVVAGRIANRLDLGGTNCVTDAACASTFSALSMAVQELYLGDSDLVIAGGVDTLNDIFMYMCFSKTPALSMSGDCRPFSDQADGTMLSEGLGMVALKRLDEAERDGDRIYAVLAGVGASSDGRSKSVYAPVSAGQARALTRAYGHAGFTPATVELIEAHGTGTKAGDAAEFGGLALAFDGTQDEGGQPGAGETVARGEAASREPQWCALGSVKSQIGHAKAAAGAAGLFKVIMALHHKVLPPTIKVARPNPKLDLAASPFYLNTVARPWIRGSDHPRRAGVSSFGFGGSNFHLALQEYEGPSPKAHRLRAMPVELVALSGADGAAVAAQALALAERAELPGTFERLAWESAQAFDSAAPARLAMVAKDGPELAARLRRLADAVARSPAAAFAHPDGSAYGVGERRGEVAFLFPGQGSQYVGMGDAVAMAFDAARGPWDRAADLDLGAPQRLHEVVFPVPKFSDAERSEDETRLRATEWAQPAIGATSLSLLALLKELGVKPELVAGHSFGEITALHAAGVLSEADMLAVARRRGELMAAAAELPGAMSAVSADIEVVTALITALSRDDVVIANHNAPSQVVLSGTVEGVEAVEARMSAAGVRFTRLQVATAFHSPVVAASVKPFGGFLAEVKFNEANLPVWSGESAAPYETKAATKRARLARQIVNPVRFVDLVSGMAEAGIHTFVEVGPGSVLTGLVDRTLKGREHLAIALDRRGKDGVVSLSAGVAQLVAAGVSLNLNALWAGYGEPEDVSLRKKARLSVPICGANHGKKYPPEGGAQHVPGPNPVVAVVAPVAPVAVRPAAPVVAQAPLAAQATAPVLAQAVAPVAATVQPPAPTAAPASASVPVVLPAGWLAAWQGALQQNAMTHTAFQQSMAQSHAAYLNTMETSIAALASLAGGAAEGAPRAAQPSAPVAVTPSASVAVPAPESVPESVPVPVPESVPVPASVAASVAAPAVTSVPRPPTLDLHALMLEVVAEKTGYPAEMLDLDMKLEGDLGIDSIKRVEILAAVQDQAHDLPEVNPARMSTLDTLGEIVAYMQSLLGEPPPTDPRPSATAKPPAATATATATVPATAPATANATAKATASAVPAVDLRALMLAVVADKTGYPAEMLDLDMKLEGDLGIDSIKRVEILAAVQEQAPDVPEVNPTRMSTLDTLGEIVTYMQSLMAGTTDQPAVAIAAAAATASPAAARTAAGATTASAAPPMPADMGRYGLELRPSPAQGMAHPALRGAEQVFVTASGSDLSAALVTELVRRGVNALAVDAVPAGASAVIFLGGLRPVADVDAAIAVQREAFAIARTLAPTVTASGGLFVTVQDTGGAFGTTPFPAERAFLAGLPALVKTASQEWPKAAVRAVDLVIGDRSAADLATVLADELLLGGCEVEVGLGLRGERLSPRSVRQPVVKGNPLIHKDEVVVVSGGGRGVTAACVIEWARDTGARFLLLGRTELVEEPACCAAAATDAELKRALLSEASRDGEKTSPAALGARAHDILASREIRATVAAVAAVGGQARYRSAGVTDPAALTAVLQEARADWGPIRALVHGAGVLADQKIAAQTDEQFDRVFNTKVEGLRSLLAALAGDPLKVICLFSSVSARCGNNGQATYAMANEVLNKVAWTEARARGGAVLVKSLGWGPWQGGMVNAQLQAHFERLGVPMIPLAVGARMFADELHGAQPDQVEIVLGGEPRAEALLVVGSEGRSLSLEVVLSDKSHAFLAGHRIGGQVVVPVVLVLEWFTRVARAFRPDLHLESIQDLSVLKGVQLRDFEGAGDRLVVHCRQLSNGHGALLALELTGQGGVVHYRAQARMCIDRPAAPTDRGADLSLRAWGGAPIYGDVLFHTDDFQVIEALDGVGEAGISGTLNGVESASWSWERWDTDVAALDGGLQLVLLWARSQMGGAVLPMAIGEVRMSAELPSQGRIQCVARCHAESKSRGLADIEFLTEAGVRFAEFKRVQLILRPERPSATA